MITYRMCSSVSIHCATFSGRLHNNHTLIVQIEFLSNIQQITGCSLSVPGGTWF